MNPLNVTKQPCRECPFRKNAIPGYLGSASGNPQLFLAAIWEGYQRQPCHLTIDWDNGEPTGDEPLCRGLLQLMKNSCSQPRDNLLAAFVSQLKPDGSIVFRWKHEFIAYHEVRA